MRIVKTILLTLLLVFIIMLIIYRPKYEPACDAGVCEGNLILVFPLAQKIDSSILCRIFGGDLASSESLNSKTSACEIRNNEVCNLFSGNLKTEQGKPPRCLSGVQPAKDKARDSTQMVEQKTAREDLQVRHPGRKYWQDGIRPSERGLAGILIRNEAGYNVPGVTLFTPSSSRSYTVDYRGYIELDQTIGDIWVPEFDEYLTSDRVNVTTAADKDLIVIKLKTKPVPEGVTLELLEAINRPGPSGNTTFTGTVTFKDGQPAANQAITFVNNKLTATTDAKGNIFKIIPSQTANYNFYFPKVDPTKYYHLDVLKDSDNNVSITLSK
jgi:hypothetical protein